MPANLRPVSSGEAVSSNKAPIAVGIIAKNAAKTIGACLDSFLPFVSDVVVCVDAATTDDTAQIAERYGARVFQGLDVSEWHECPDHGRVKAQHFAKAREFSFSKLHDEPWLMWLDSDDVLVGGEKLCRLIDSLHPNIAGVWLPYHYAQAGAGGPTTTLFDRERIVRRSIGWQWQHRVHEVLAPVDRPTESLEWLRTNDISVVHQSEGHDTAGSARRNILLLEIDLESDPNDMRALFYLGNQYFALGEWQPAIHYYERSTAANNQYQVWQTYLYLSMAYEKLGNLLAAKQAAYAALDTAPYHPEPYYRLAAVDGLLRGDVQRCEFWTKRAEGLPDAPFFAFRNPLDRTFNSHLTLGNAYQNVGLISRARAEYEQAAASGVESPEVAAAIASTRQLEEESQTADAWARTLQSLQGSPLGTGHFGGLKVSDIPASVWKFGRVRDVVIPAILSERPNTQPRVIFFCGRSVEPWAPPSLETGIGGSETAVIEIAKRFAAAGFRTDVFNEPDYLEGIYDGVGYWSLSRLQAEHTDILVSWRNPTAATLPVDRHLSILWCHDLNQGPDALAQMGAWGLVLGVSQWHSDYLRQVYHLPAEQVSYVPNGINLSRFSGEVKRVPFRCIYASSPDRGLERLLHIWPEIVKQEPAAELHIAYGWDTIDKTIAFGLDSYGQLAMLKAKLTHLMQHTPSIVWHGRLGQQQLAGLFQESYLWLYPTSFTEVSCITAMEAVAAGCVPVVSAVGALPETVGNAGLVVPGNTYTPSWLEYYTHVARGALHSPDVRLPLAASGQQRAEELTWDKAFQKWEEIVVAKLEGKQPAEALS